MGDIVIQRAYSEIWWTGQPAWRPIDEANPPQVPPGTEILFFIRFASQGTVTRSVNAEAKIVDPQGHTFVPGWHPQPSFPYDLPPGAPSGQGLFFIAETPGIYSLHFEVHADGILSDSWSFPACDVLAPEVPEPPPPPPPPETGAFVGLIGMVLIAELVAGLAEGIVE